MLWRNAEGRRVRVVVAAVTALVLSVTIGGWAMAMAMEPDWFAGSFGIDLRIYLDALGRWAGGGSWYRPRQVDGPYAIELGDVLYPPILIYLLAPFQFLGPWAWAVIPAAVIAWVVWRHRPNLWALAGIAICLAWPVTPAKFVFGNPVIWCAAAVALGTIWRWPAAFALLKPTVIPFALIGIRDRRWWLTVMVMVVASLPFLADTISYPNVLLAAGTNPVDGRGGPFYSLQEFPLLAIPILAWLGRRRHKLPG